MQVNCSLAQNILSAIWFVIGAVVVGLPAYMLGKRSKNKGEFIYRGPGGEE